MCENHHTIFTKFVDNGLMNISGKLEGCISKMKISMLNQQLQQQGERILKNEAEIHRLEELQATSEYDIKKLENKLDEKENELS